MTQPQANRWIHLLSDILRRTLKTLGELPDRNSKRLIHILQGCEEVLLDGTERPIQRPLDESPTFFTSEGRFLPGGLGQLAEKAQALFGLGLLHLVHGESAPLPNCLE